MPHSFQHSLTFYRELLPEKLRWLFLAHTLRGGAQNMAGLFVPLFLFTQADKLGLVRWLPQLSQTPLLNSFFTICAFFFCSRLVTLLFSMGATRIMRSIGLVKSMLIGNACLAGMYLSLLAAADFPWMLGVSAMLGGLEILFYWIPYNTEFSAHSNLQKLRQEVSVVHLGEKVLRAMVPMVGGLLIVSFGYEGLYILAATVLFISCMLLLSVPELHFTSLPSWRELSQWLRQVPGYKQIALGMMGGHWEDCGIVIWPVYLFLFLGTAERVGYAYTVVLLASFVSAYIFGWIIGKKYERTMFSFNTVLLAGLWILRIFASQIWHLLGIDMIEKLANSVYVPGFDVLMFGHSRHRKMLEFFTYREILISFASLLFWAVAAAAFLTKGWPVLFVVAGVGTLVSLLLGTRTMKLEHAPALTSVQKQRPRA